MTKDVLSIAAAAYGEMLAHCVAESPREAVGLLSGRGRAVLQSYALRNIVPAPRDRRFFLADPYDQFLAQRSIAVARQEVIAIYHSHPDGGAALSSEDTAASGQRDRIQVVIALTTSRTACPVVRAFRQSAEGRAMEVSLRIAHNPNECRSDRRSC